MEKHFDQELSELKKELLKLGTLVEQAIFRSVEALKELNEQKARQVIADDKLVDEIENGIDEQCMDLLALRQPMAMDLRFITMVLGITTDLERMADLGVDIAQRVLELVGKPLLKPLVDIPKLTEIAQRMTRCALDAFVNKDAHLARQVISWDSEADQLRNFVQKELLEDYMMKDPRTTSRALPLLLIARHLERICDHATNIAEDVIYMLEAKVVKHHPELLRENGGKETAASPKKVLFVCIHNSARSQMAEAFLNQLGGKSFLAESAGLEPGKLNPLAVEVMREKGMDISQKTTQSVFDLYRQGRLYDYVITVCDESQSERCPVFPGITQRLHWGFADPSAFQGTHDEQLAQTRMVRDAIEKTIREWVESAMIKNA